MTPATTSPTSIYGGVAGGINPTNMGPPIPTITDSKAPRPHSAPTTLLLLMHTLCFVLPSLAVVQGVEVCRTFNLVGQSTILHTAGRHLSLNSIKVSGLQFLLLFILVSLSWRRVQERRLILFQVEPLFASLDHTILLNCRWLTFLTFIQFLFKKCVRFTLIRSSSTNQWTNTNCPFPFSQFAVV